MTAGDPKAQPPYRLDELTPDQFEGLVFRLAWAENAAVVRLRAPDGGLDTVLVDPDRPEAALRGWQAKRHTQRIDISDCQRSLDRAVTVWAPQTVTFVFPHDLTASEHTAFTRDVAARHPDVSVDYWGRSVVLARLDSEEGRRIAAVFFEEHDAVEIAERMLRAGSPLKSGVDLVEAEFAIADGLAQKNVDYDWIILHGAVDAIGPPPLSPSTIMRIALTRGKTVMYADCVPRHSSPSSRPELSLQPDDSPEGRQARQWLDALLSGQGGGRLSLRDGVRFALSDIPPPFDDLLDEEALSGGEVTIKAVAEPPPFYAQVIAGNEAIDIDLLPITPTEEWDAELQGRIAGLVLTLRFVWSVNQGLGRLNISFEYRHTNAPHAVEASLLKWLLATHRHDEVVIEDRQGERPSIRQPTNASTPEPWLELWAQLHEDLALLEQAAGTPAPPVPDIVSTEDVERIATMARILRVRRIEATVSDATLSFSSDALDFPLHRIVYNMTRQGTLVAQLFGDEQLAVAQETIPFPPMIVIERVVRPNGVDVRFVPLTGSDAQVICEVTPLSEVQKQ
jgi:hypothetical protein